VADKIGAARHLPHSTREGLRQCVIVDVVGDVIRVRLREKVADDLGRQFFDALAQALSVRMPSQWVVRAEWV